MQLFRTMSIAGLVALSFLIGAFATQTYDHAVVTLDVAQPTHPWYWDMPIVAWTGYAILLLVIIGVCLLAAKMTSGRQLSDGPVK